MTVSLSPLAGPAPLPIDFAADAEALAAARSLRAAVRAGQHDSRTTGLAPGMVQANLAILPAADARDFAEFCALNPKPCPLLTMTEPGDPMLPELGADIDLRTDLPRYQVFRDGVRAEELTDLREIWRDDFVAFPLGCSYSFEEALLRDGLPIRHQELGIKVPIYATNIQTTPVGKFRGLVIVSMRPFTPAQAIRAIEITARFPRVHGAPVHFGAPEAIGIDIDQPWSGAPPVIHAGEVPLFWACGVTPQLIIEQARPSIAITHKPGHMLVTDLSNQSLRD